MPISDSSQNPLDILSAVAGGTSGRKHPVPQNVMDVEFKIVGDLTLRQLVYVFAGLGLAYFLYNSPLPRFWDITLAIGALILSVAVAFVPYEERGLDKWLILFLNGMRLQTQMIWRKSSAEPAYFLTDYTNIIKNEIITLTPTKSRSKLDEYLGLIDDDNDALDVYKKENLSNVKNRITSNDSQFPPSIGMPIQKSIHKDEKESKAEFIQAFQTGNSIMNNPQNIDRPLTAVHPTQQNEIEIVKPENSVEIKNALNQTQESIDAETHNPETLEKQAQDLLTTSVKAKEHLEKKGLTINQNIIPEISKYKENIKTNEQNPKTTQSNEMNNPADIAKQNINQAQKPQINKNPISQQNTAPISNVNVIYGKISDSQNNPIADVIVLIKDIYGNVLRAIKTNKDGDFRTQGTLASGFYDIQCIKDQHNFDIIRVEANGKEMSPIYLKAK